MKALGIAAIFAAGALAGCMAAGPPLGAQTPRDAADLRSIAPPMDASTADPLLLDRGDLRLGTTVQFHRLPTVAEFHDALQVRLVQHVVLSLAEWPLDTRMLENFASATDEADVIVILPGYPPSRAAAEAWNYAGQRVRLVLVVNGPPPDRAVLDDLNRMRSLERVIAQMSEPSRAGFERFQRPLSFRKLMN